MSPTEQHWDHEVGFLVVGSGAGGLTGALAAADRGSDTLIIEKAAYYGGSTALSGGGVWVPNNPVLLREGLRDSRADVRAYLDAVVGDRVPSANLDAFIEEGPAMRTFWREPARICGSSGAPAIPTIIRRLPVDVRPDGRSNHCRWI